jgi:hypothetical protein
METNTVLECVENILFGNPRETDWPMVRAYLAAHGYEDVAPDADAEGWCGEAIDELVREIGADELARLATANDCQRVLRLLNDTFGVGGMDAATASVQGPEKNMSQADLDYAYDVKVWE